jgi:hypothetical protein
VQLDGMAMAVKRLMTGKRMEVNFEPLHHKER